MRYFKKNTKINSQIRRDPVMIDGIINFMDFSNKEKKINSQTRRDPVMIDGIINFMDFSDKEKEEKILPLQNVVQKKESRNDVLLQSIDI